MKRLAMILTCLFMLVGMAVAQTRVSGVVLSEEDGQPVVGASIIVKGTTVGTITDLDGKFTLTGIPSSAKTLVVSYVGMKTQEVGIKANLSVTLKSDAEVLDDVIVVAYGTAKKSSFTGSASTVGAQTLEKRVLSSAMNALEGNTSGVQVTSASGQPGESASIRVRGFGSVNASNKPLYVVDGSIYEGEISDINPADIESMTILKDAASTSLYGSSAGNGVVLITTKSGKGNNGTIGINLNIQQGWSNRAYKDYKRMGINDYFVNNWERLKNQQITAGKSAAEAAELASGSLIKTLQYNPFKGVEDLAVVGTDGRLNPGSGLKWGDDLDWDKEAYRTGYRQEYNLSYNTKTEKSDTYASVGYLNEKGYMIVTDFERYTGRINYNINPFKWMKTGVNLGFTRTKSTYSSSTQGNSGAYSNLTGFTRNIGPYWPIHQHNDKGEYIDAQGDPTTDPSKYEYDYANRLVGMYVGRDGVAETLLNNRALERMNENGKVYLTIMPIDGLSLTANYSINNLDYRAKQYENPWVGDGTAGPARLSIQATRTMTQTFNQIAQYNKSFGSHNLDVTLGHENYSYKREYMYAMKVGETFHGINDFENFTSISSLTSYTNNYTKEGYFARVNYDFDNRYYVSASYRRDGSSRFSKDNRWGNFWSFGLSWRLTQEAFMKNVEWLNNLKIRASYGQTGNDAILTSSGGNDYYPYQTLYELGHNNGTEAGAYFTTIANPNLKWETQISMDLGLEFGLFDNRISGNVEYFRKDSKDLLFDVAQPYSSGVTSIIQNIGKVSNSGVEINLDINILKLKDFSLNFGANATFVKNKIVSLPESMKVNPKGYVNGSKVWVEGKSMYEFWLYQWRGVDSQTGNGLFVADTEKYNSNNIGTKDGNISQSQYDAAAKTFQTQNGETVTDDYSYAKFEYSGASIPKMYGGFNFNVQWKSFSLAATFSYQLGGKILDSTYGTLMAGNLGNAWAEDLSKAWRKPGDITDVPRIDATAAHNTNIGQSYSTRWLTSSNYLNLRSINLGYNLPKSLLSKCSIKSARINVTCENVFMLKARQGMNPMASFNGLTYNEYMPSRNFTIGLNVGF